jgi:hypothetical protein
MYAFFASKWVCTQNEANTTTSEFTATTAVVNGAFVGLAPEEKNAKHLVIIYLPDATIHFSDWERNWSKKN